VRGDLITAANDLAAAVLMNATHASMRLAQALHVADPAAKVQAIQAISQHELAAFGQLNGLCGKIYAAGNALNHGLTPERWNINLGSLDDAKATFQALNAAEWGLQALFAQQLQLDPAQDVDAWIRAKIAWLAEVCTAASAAVTQLAAAI
jgi:hypothetical protein